MIAIVNVDPNPRTEGEHLYEIRINRKVVTQFTHERSEPLHVCLERAAQAARESRYKLLSMLAEESTAI